MYIYSTLLKLNQCLNTPIKTANLSIKAITTLSMALLPPSKPQLHYQWHYYPYLNPKLNYQWHYYPFKPQTKLSMHYYTHDSSNDTNLYLITFPNQNLNYNQPCPNYTHQNPIFTI